MRHIKIVFQTIAWVIPGLVVGLSRADIAKPQKPWKEVYELIRTNLHFSKESDLNQAAVEQLLEKHPNRIHWETNSIGSGEAVGTDGPATSGRVFEAGIGYVRIARVDETLPQAFQSEWARVTSTNKLKGFVLDLRYAGGSDYEASARTARAFVPGEEPLLTLAGKPIQAPSSAGFKPLFEIPLVVLVNGETRGAAEALMAILRYERASLVLGSDTAGSAGIYQLFTLSNGDRLRLLTGDIKTASGSSVAGVQLSPDIRVEVNSKEERRFWTDPYAKALPEAAEGSAVKTASAKAPLKPAVKINEAALVRRQREDRAGFFNDDLSGERTAAIEKPRPPELRDPALARALDVLQGIAILGSQTAPAD